MGAAIIHEKNNFPFLLAHFSVEFSDSVCENLLRHQSILVGPVGNWKTFPTETPRFFALPDDEESSLITSIHIGTH